MRVPDEWLSSVCFLGLDMSHDDVFGTRYMGTGFYFSIENEFDASIGHLYLVTDRHTIEGAQASAGALVARLNTEDGASVTTELSKLDWTFHDDPTVDLAVLGIRFTGADSRRAEIVRLHPDVCLDAEQTKRYDIGAGSEISVIGMFHPRRGEERNIPIVRSGVISAMPSEPIYDESAIHGPYTAYLVEVLSLAGLSGSPVFVHAIAGPHHRHPQRPVDAGTVEVSTQWDQHSFVLGVVRSHFDERPSERAEEVPRPEWINKGIAAVTPIERLLEMLQYDTFRRDRREEVARVRTREVGHH